MNTFYLETITEFSNEYKITPPYVYDISCPPHIHKSAEVLYVIKGQCKANVNDHSIILTDNQMAVADSYDIHSWQAIGECVAEYFVIPYSALTDFIEAKHGKKLSSNYILDEALSLRFKAILDLIRQNINLHDAYINSGASVSSRMVNDGLSKAFFGMLLENIRLEYVAKKTSGALVSQTLEYVANNFTKPISLETISDHFGYSKYYFGKLFKQMLGYSFESYINMLRTHNVLLLVKNSGCSVTNAILDSGFSSIPTFYRHFSKQYGCSLTYYLKRQRQLTNITSPHLIR